MSIASKRRRPRINQNAYLERRGEVWYVTVRVPPSVREVIGSAHLRQCLKTSSLSEANSRKHAWVDSFKRQIRNAQRTAVGHPPDLREAMVLRAEIAEARRRDEKALDQFDGDPRYFHGDAEALSLHATDIAKDRYHSGQWSIEKAREFVAVVTSESQTLDELHAEFLQTKEYSHSAATNSRNAYKLFRQYLCKALKRSPLVSSVDETAADSFIQDCLGRSDLAPGTRLLIPAES